MPAVRTLLAVIGLGLLWPGVAAAQSQEVPPAVDVVELSGPLDRLAVDFAIDRIDRAAARGSQLVVLQVDSPAGLEQDVVRLITKVAAPPLPLAVWIGPAPARAYGAGAAVLEAAPLRLAAPGARLGYVRPLVVGSPGPAPPSPLLDTEVVVEAPIPGLVDDVQPSLFQVLTSLDGRRAEWAGGTRSLELVGPALNPDGSPQVDADGRPLRTVVADVRFQEPGVGTRLLRTATRPEVAFFFLAVGLTVAVFELYAVGPGVAASVAVTSLLLGGYGVAVLPVRWWALALGAAALIIMTAEFQTARFGRWSLLATGALVVAGGWFTDAAPQLRPSWWGVGLTVAVIVFLYAVALPVVGRARFSTRTVGREHLVGRTGVAVTDLTPEGKVEVDGATWMASSHREAGIRAGHPVSVTAVHGTVLEVDRGHRR